MTITAESIKDLREQTGAGVMDVKEALQEANGDRDKAIELLRKKGMKTAEKKADRTAKEGWIGWYVHATGKIAALVVVNCETDFVARNSEFQALAKDIAMQVAALAPEYITPNDVPEDVKEREKDVYRAQLAKEGKSEAIMEKILEGKLQKFYSDVCLVKQPFFKDDKLTIEDLINQAVAKLGEKIEVTQMTRLVV
ncbi:MAG: translation elongation factor Ts [Candidatus Kerfeldbacteria bacterium]|nr:translation elongation factor Ts [Candidatus Kerfeldbacteria bacterium]